MSYYLVHDSSGEHVVLNTEASEGITCGIIPYFEDAHWPWCTFHDLSMMIREKLTGEESTADEEPMFDIRYAIDPHEKPLVSLYAMEVRWPELPELPILLDKYCWTRINSYVQKAFDYIYPPVVSDAVRNILQEGGESRKPCSSIPRMFFRNEMGKIKKEFQESIINAGFTVRYNIEQTQTGPDSMVLSIETSEGLIYCKKTGPGSPEASITKILGSNLPNLVVEPILVDSEKNSFCTMDFVSKAAYALKVAETNPVLKRKTQLELVELIFRFHQKATKLIPAMTQINVSDTSPKAMKMEFNWFLEKLHDIEFLSPSDIVRLRSLSAPVNSLLDKFIASPIPLTVCHGDLATHNITWDIETPGKKARLYDWYEGTISHPFLDFVGSGDDIRVLKEEYISMWRDYDTLLNLRHLYSMAETLQGLWEAFRFVKIQLRCAHSLNWHSTHDYCGFRLQKFMKKIENG